MPFRDAEFQTYALKPGDILLNEGQSLELVGRSAIYEGPKDTYCFQNTLVRFRPSQRIDVRYAQFSFQYMLVTGVFATIASRTTSIAHLGVERFASLHISLPPLEVQRAISNVIGVWDRGIRQLTDLIAAKVRFKQGLMQHLLTGQRRFKGFRDEWQPVQLHDVTTECDERNRGRLGLDSVMAVTKAEGIVPMRERTIGADIGRYLIVRKNWFAYNPMRINIGSIARWFDDKEIVVSPDYVVFRCNDSNGDGLGMDPDYLDHLRRSGIWERFVTAAGNGSVRVRIYYSDLGHLKFKLPNLIEQRRIANLLNIADQEIDLLRKKLEALKQQKKALMRKLLTGQVKVKP